jgi:hypothetical protein
MAEEPGDAGARARKLRFALASCAVIVLVAVGLVFARGLMSVGVPVTGLMYDAHRLRCMWGVFVEAAAMPLAADGRIDVYAVLKDRVPETVVDLCRCARAGKGPTWDDIAAGDYATFGYQRSRGMFDREAAPHVPVLWDRAPQDGRRLALFSDGWVGLVAEAEVQEFFRNTPGQE